MRYTDQDATDLTKDIMSVINSDIVFGEDMELREWEVARKVSNKILQLIRKKLKLTKSIGVENCEDCKHGKCNDGFAFCKEAESGTGKMIPINLWTEGIIPDWCPLEEE